MQCKAPDPPQCEHCQGRATPQWARYGQQKCQLITARVLSQTLANLEQQVGFPLFDRQGRSPRLTEAGRALLADARMAAASMDAFKAKARTLAEGVEPELSVAIDVMYPMSILTDAIRAFHEAFPDTPLRLYVEALGAVLQPVLDGRCHLGVIGSFPDVPSGCRSEYLLSVPAITVVAPTHPLATNSGLIAHSTAADYIQLVLTDRSALTVGRNFGILSSKVWRLADLGAKHAFLRAGLGWGHMPEPMVEEDIARGALVRIKLQPHPTVLADFSMHAIYREETPPGPAGRWLVDHLKQR
jgi:DNA-binding transcriptional LysR family regulator